MIADQVAYYRARARDYDDVYERRGAYDRGTAVNRAWRAELALLEAALDELDLRGDVLELGAGTGQWTARLARRARTVTALDAAPEMLAVAKARLAQPAAGVHFDVVDLLGDWEPARSWNAVVACFFYEHVPDRHLPGLLGKVRRALTPRGFVFLAEGAYRPADEESEVRALHGRRYHVVERRRRPEELARRFGEAGIDLRVRETGQRFQYGVGRRSDYPWA